MRRYLIWIIPVLFGSIALLSIVYRLSFAYADYCCRDMLAERLSDQIGIEVNIGSIHIELQGYAPIIKLTDVVIRHPGDDDGLKMAELYVEVDLLGSIAKRGIAIRGFHLHRSELIITPASLDERQSMGIKEMIGLGSFETDQYRELSISVNDSQLRWYDEESGEPHHFDNLNFAVDIERDRRQFALNADLPEFLGRRLNLSGEIIGTTIEQPDWQSNFHLKAVDLRIENWLQILSLLNKLTPELTYDLSKISEYQGILSMDTQGIIDAQDEFWLSGDLECRNCALNMEEEFSTGAYFFLEHNAKGQRLMLSELYLDIPGLTFDNASFAARYLGDDSMLELAVGSLDFDQADAERVFQFLGEWNDEVPVTAQAGTLSLAGGIEVPGKVNWKDWAQVSSDYEMSSLRTAYAEIEFKEMKVSLPRWYDGRLALDEMNLALKFARKATDYEMQFSPFAIRSGLSEIGGQAVWSVSQDDKQIFLDMDISDLPLTQVYQWVPSKVLKPRLDKWLQKAFHGGVLREGEVAFYGTPEKFPFTDGGGKFFAVGQVENAEIDYRKNRRRLKNVAGKVTFSNQSFSADMSELDYYTFHSNDVQVRIADVLAPYIEVDAVGQGSLDDVFAYLKQAELINSSGVLMSNMEFGGNSKIELSVGVPLSKKVDLPVSVDGRLGLDQSEISLPSLDLQFSGVNGHIDFDETGGNSDNLSAYFGDQLLRGTVRSNQGINTLSMEGDIQIDHLLIKSMRDWREHADGNSKWRLRLDLPNPNRQRPQDEFTLALSSDLEGTSLDFPEPFSKTAEEVRQFGFEIEVSSGNRVYRVSADDFFNGLIRKDGQGELAGFLNFGNAEEPDVIEGLSINGQIDESVSISEWMQFSDGMEGDKGALASLRKVKLEISELLINDMNLGKTKFELEYTPEDIWVADIHSDIFKGNMVLSDDNEYLQANMEQLLISDKSIFGDTFGGLGNGISPDALPKLEITATRFQYGNLSGKNLILTMRPVEGGFRIDNLQFSSGKSIINVKGDWLESPIAQSRFKIDIKSEDFGSLSSGWKISDSIEGRGALLADLSWAGSPQDFSLSKLKGTVEVDWRKGQLKAVNPGVGRLLGLFNVNSLIQRLSVDFRDLFDEGLAYDTLSGTLEFERGDMFTENLFLSGPALTMKIKGRTGIVAKDYEQEIKIVPNLSSSLPVASALLAGPLAGIAVLLAEKVTEIDAQINKMVTLNYVVEGSWDDPQINLVEGGP